MKNLNTAEPIYKRKNRKLEFKSLREILNNKRIPPEPIIGNGILLPKTLLLIVGGKKGGKSMLSYNISCLLAVGKSNTIFKIEKPYKVLLASAEGGEFPNEERIRIMMNKFPEFDGEHYICSSSRIKLNNEDDLDLLREDITEKKPDVLIIDPLIKFHDSDENSSQEMAYVLSKLRELIEDFNLSIILIHHSGKDAERGARGSSVIEGEYDSCISMSGDIKKTITCSFEMRHVETPEPMKIKFNKDTYWFEKDLGNLSSTAKLILDEGPKSKSELADKLVALKKYSSVPNAYKAISSAVNKGELILDDEGNCNLAA